MSHSNTLRKALRNPLVLSFYLPALIVSCSFGLLTPILPLYVKDFQISYGLVGLVLAGAGLGTLVGDVPSGLLLRRWGKKNVMLAGLVIVALSTTALFWAASILQVLACRLVTGFGQSLYNVARHAYIADMTRVVGRGKAIALTGGVFRIGSFVGPAVGGSVAAAFGLHAPFLLFGVTLAAAIVVVALFVRINEPRPTSTATSKSQSGHLLANLKTHYRVLAAAGAGQLFAQMIRAGRRVVIPLYAADVIGLDAQDIGFIESLSSAMDMTLFYPTGVIMDRWGRKFAIVPSFLIQAVGLSLVPLTGSFESLLLTTTLIGFGNGLGSGTMMTLGADLAPRDAGAQGEFLGVWRLIGDGGFTGAPLIVGAVADLFVLQTAAWTMAGAGLAAGLVFALLVPETLKRRQPAVEASCGD